MRHGGKKREILDGSSLSARAAAEALADLERVNRWSFGISAVLRSAVPRLAGGRRRQRVLDLGTGSGQVPEALSAAMARQGVRIRVVGVDRKLAHLLVGRARRPEQLRVVADASCLPFRAGSLDWSLSTLFLHHFGVTENLRVLREMQRVSREGVVAVDLRDSLLARSVWGLLSRLLALGEIAAHDGHVSLDRAWSVESVRRMTADLPVIEVRRRFPLRLSLVIGGGRERDATRRSGAVREQRGAAV